MSLWCRWLLATGEIMRGGTSQWRDGDGRMVGSVTFLDSEPYYADNDLGDGAEIRILLRIGSGFEPVMDHVPVVIHWTAWNRFTWAQA